MYYFAADIHLGAGPEAEARRNEQRFVAWLTQVAADAEAIYLLGDVFDFWFEYQHVVPKGFVRTLGKLAELTDRGIKIVMLTGNHDMWIGDYLHRECGLELHTRPQLLHLAGRNIYVAHGDNTNIQGRLMLRLMNAMFRSRTLKFLFSWLVHPDFTLWFGHRWSGHSRKSHGEERNPHYLHPLMEEAARIASREKVDAFIFGHMHIPYTVDTPQHILFLGDWNTRPNYVCMDTDHNPQLNYFD